jgi:hypothetical protein
LFTHLLRPETQQILVDFPYCCVLVFVAAEICFPSHCVATAVSPGSAIPTFSRHVTVYYPSVWCVLGSLPFHLFLYGWNNIYWIVKIRLSVKDVVNLAIFLFLCSTVIIHRCTLPFFCFI